MADNNVRLPSSGGGLVSYSDETKSKLIIPPIAVAIAVGIVALLGILLYKGVF